MRRYLLVLLFAGCSLYSAGTDIKMKITRHYLNIPIGSEARMKLVKLSVGGRLKSEFPVQLAEDTVGYWIYVDLSAFMGQTVNISCPATASALARIYQADTINGSDSLYKESNRPQFHFTVKRGWSNDINGPIYYNGVYHMFWQSFPYGLSWNTAFMNWGHAVSKDMLHWEELAPALMPDSLGSPWSGTAVVDTNNDGGWGKNALVLFYTAFDWVSEKEVECIAYSTDDAKTFTRFKGNPVIDSNSALGSTQTRDPKVFWYAPTRTWVMVLFEKDGMSFYNSGDLKAWKRQSHFAGLHECPDFFELPVDGNPEENRWVLHGGSSDYFIGRFDGKTFTPETPRLRYAEGQSDRRGDLLYAAISFANMPDNRRVQIAWGRLDHPGMPFTQMMLFPTEFRLRTTPQGIRLMASPIKEIEQLHGSAHIWNAPSVGDANEELHRIKPGPLDIKMKFTLSEGHTMNLRYGGNELLTLSSKELTPGENNMEILIDKTVAEIFINQGERYIIRNLAPAVNDHSLEFDSGDYGPLLSELQVYEMKSIWEKQ